MTPKGACLPYSRPNPAGMPLARDAYGVEDLGWLVGQLRSEGVTILDDIERFEYGKFVHILDPEGNKIELWEANDDEYDKILEVQTS